MWHSVLVREDWAATAVDKCWWFRKRAVWGKKGDCCTYEKDMNDYDDDDDDHYDWSLPLRNALVSRSTKGAIIKRNNINRPFDLFTKAPQTRLMRLKKSYEPKIVCQV